MTKRLLSLVLLMFSLSASAQYSGYVNDVIQLPSPDNRIGEYELIDYEYSSGSCEHLDTPYNGSRVHILSYFEGEECVECVARYDYSYTVPGSPSVFHNTQTDPSA